MFARKIHCIRSVFRFFGFQWAHKFRIKICNMSNYSLKNKVCSSTTILYVFNEGACLTDVGKVFHSLGAENVNVPV